MFASREDAGQKLGRWLQQHHLRAELVLGLPRGGVIVAAEVARALHLPLGVLVVRKIGHPWHREFAVGALAEGGVVLLDEAVIARHPLPRRELEDVISEEKRRLEEYQRTFHQPGVASLANKVALLVDDGLATGATTEAAVLSARKQNARRVVVAVPVASTNAVARLQNVADEVIALLVDPDFDAVGRYYDRFAQTTDDEVLACLQTAQRALTERST